MTNLTGPWMLGQDLTAITAAPVVIGAGNSVTIGTARDLIGVIRRIGHQVERQFDEIAPITQGQLNDVPIRWGNRIQIVTLKYSNSAQALNDLNNGYTHIFVSWTEGKEKYDGYFVLGNVDGGIDGHGQQIITQDCGPVSLVGLAQVVRTVLS